MRRIFITACALLILSTTLVSCTNNNIQSDKPSPDTCDCGGMNMERFYDFDSFAEYCKNPESQTGKYQISPYALVNFDSIIPNSEIYVVDLYSGYYTITYEEKSAVDTVIMVEYRENAYQGSQDNIVFEETAIENTDMTEKRRYHFNVNGTCVTYMTSDTGMVNAIYFTIGSHMFHLGYILETHSRTDAQNAFIEAFFTEQGTADMLAKIEALIPKK